MYIHEKEITKAFIGFAKNYNTKFECKLSMEAEKTFSSILYPMKSGAKITDKVFAKVKKRYIGILNFYKGTKVDKLYARGISLRRKDTPDCFKDVVGTTVRMLLEEKL